jgi:surface antigen
VLIGGLLGGALGNVLDQRDRELAQRNAYAALENAPTGGSSEWRNPDNGHHGSFTPTRTWQTGSGQYCREYQQVIVVGGDRQEAYGTACRQPDGTWQIAN